MRRAHAVQAIGLQVASSINFFLKSRNPCQSQQLYECSYLEALLSRMQTSETSLLQDECSTAYSSQASSGGLSPQQRCADITCRSQTSLQTHCSPHTLESKAIHPETIQLCAAAYLEQISVKTLPLWQGNLDARPGKSRGGRLEGCHALHRVVQPQVPQLLFKKTANSQSMYNELCKANFTISGSCLQACSLK